MIRAWGCFGRSPCCWTSVGFLHGFFRHLSSLLSDSSHKLFILWSRILVLPLGRLFPPVWCLSAGLSFCLKSCCFGFGYSTTTSSSDEETLGVDGVTRLFNVASTHLPVRCWISNFKSAISSFSSSFSFLTALMFAAY